MDYPPPSPPPLPGLRSGGDRLEDFRPVPPHQATGRPPPSPLRGPRRPGPCAALGAPKGPYAARPRTGTWLLTQ